MRTPTAIAVNAKGTGLVVACDDGTVWMWAPVPPTDQEQAFEQQRRLVMSEPVEHTWIQFHTPIPGSVAYQEYAEK